MGVIEQFISILVFSIPGLMAFFWIRSFGLNPPDKYDPTEMVGIVALLWMPTTILSLLAYNLLYFLFDNLLTLMRIDATGLNLTYAINLHDIATMSSTNTLFLIFFISLSVAFSFIFAYIWSLYLYKWLLKIVNKVRLSRDLSELDGNSSIWDKFFIEIEEEQDRSEDGAPLIVEVYTLANPNNREYGSVVLSSRPFEAERAIVLDNPRAWKEHFNKEKFEIKRTYLDLKTGIVVNEIIYKS